MHPDPIFERLTKGDLFSYSLLRTEREAVVQYWNWWWEQADRTKLDRPKTLVDDDHILTVTASKPSVDSITDDFFFSDPLRHALSVGELPRGHQVDRPGYRQAIVDMLMLRCAPAHSPTLVFTGGGYGAGKTNTLHWLANDGKAPGGITLSALQGVDYCKQLLPEFNQVKMVSDGRASEICQEESRLISDLLFCQLVSDKRTFGWDSSMSNKENTLKKIESAGKAGYRLVLIAVLTQTEVAVRRAMERAKKTRRFAPPKYLHDSHTSFATHLGDYVDRMDEVLIIENSRNSQDGGPHLLAQKMPGEKALKVFDPPLFESYTSNHS
jgi:predicted ABC-type ATPase